jgi:hypothetical protein
MKHYSLPFSQARRGPITRTNKGDFMQVAEIMTRDLEAVPPKFLPQEAALKMEKLTRRSRRSNDGKIVQQETSSSMPHRVSGYVYF